MTGWIRRRRPKRPAVDMGELKRKVVNRDKACMAAVLGFRHECRDEWGDPHAARDSERLTLEHVKTELRMGRRADDDERHTVAVCAAINLQPPTKEMRAAFRRYLARESTKPKYGAWT